MAENKSYTQILNDVYDDDNHVLKTSATITGDVVVDDVTISNPPTNPAVTMPGAPTTASLSSASITVSGSGDTTLVTGISAQTIRIFRMFFVTDTAVDVTLKDGSTELTGPMSFAANGGMVLDFNGEPWFVTSTAAAFVINLSEAAQVSGRVYYKQS